MMSGYVDMLRVIDACLDFFVHNDRLLSSIKNGKVN